jgi:lactoylglutathione lyase
MKKGFIKGLAHIGIFVSDMNKSVDFYKRLGFTLDTEENPGVKLAFLSAGTCLIELIEQPDAGKRLDGRIDHIAVEVDDINAAIENANANGIEIDAAAIASAPILGGIKNVFFTGPDGERLEFFAY